MKGVKKFFQKTLQFWNKIPNDYPEVFPKKNKGFREFNLKSFPYIMIYILNIREATVFAVFHTQLDPTKKP